MAKIKLTFNDDHIKLIRAMYVNEFDKERYGIDTYNLFGGTFLYEQMALILGKMDKMDPDSTEDPMGPRFDNETMEYFKDLDAFIVGNAANIEELLHQFCTEGIQAGVTYSCQDYQHIWKKEA